MGAFLILLQSLYLAAFGSFFSTSTWGVLGLSVQELGGFGILVAVLLEVFAISLYFAPDRHLFLGVGMLTLSLLSAYSGGGLILGSFLCYIASVIAIFSHPPPTLRRSPVISAPEAQEDPVIEADLLDSG